MVSLMSTLALLAVGSLGISPIVLARFVILVSIPILSVLAWGVAIVRALILVTPLVWPVFLLVSVASVSMVDRFGGFVAVATLWFAGLGLVFRLLAF
jgi:hypothetical protein